MMLRAGSLSFVCFYAILGATLGFGGALLLSNAGLLAGLLSQLEHGLTDMPPWV